MFKRTICRRTMAALASISLLGGCGLLSGGGSQAQQEITVGTTSEPSTLDPAASWDGSWELYRNVFQTLVAFPTGSSAPQPDAAQSCQFQDKSSRTFTCTLRKGMTFSDGATLDANAVKYSIDRIVKINVKAGPKGLLSSLDHVSVDNDLTVTFHLNKPDATFPYVLGAPAMSIVDPKAYPADKLRDDGGLTGSGPYTLDSYKAGDRAVLKKNDSYQGFAQLKNDGVTIRYFRDSKTMVDALKNKQIDVTYRGITADEVEDVRNEKAAGKPLELVENTGTEIRFLVFNPKDPEAANPAVRRAVAQLVDRDALVAKVYKGTAEPLYSMVPTGVNGHTTSFFDTFGSPSVDKAKQILRKAGITGPVPLTFWYTTDRYGSSMAAEFQELKRQLDASGLFKITLDSRPWKTYTEGFQAGEFPVFGRGWFPDFPDPDNFIAPFVGKENAVGTPYEPREITTQLIPQSREISDRGAVSKQFERAQDILVDDVRLLPLWQGKLYIAASDDIAGGERAMDPQTVMQMWELHRKTSW
ncbi:solute-binding transport lipoprotein [Streptomyces violascens]|uniref:Solute-binding transport lipoprotein n=2 Tax=Streptomyces violascens TaxID=67381 RepID=A0ABQ3QHE0_9ACTN|nr:solute-binding transport lipoprotein [Streptomyces violascens]GHI36700.1 solute-binding transport lipoprotein [Streptomyces violascens]